jgi:succinate dehydrogenase/fumarate reductase cytochrome b subunit
MRTNLGFFADNSPARTQLTWYLSSANRITGVALSSALYGASLLYLLHPYYPAIDSAHLVQLVSGQSLLPNCPGISTHAGNESLFFCPTPKQPTELPTWAKVSGKFLVALPFTFHSFNGIRHLLWDVNKGEFGTQFIFFPFTIPSIRPPPLATRFARPPRLPSLTSRLVSFTATTLRGVYATGYAVLAATAISTLYLAMI